MTESKPKTRDGEGCSGCGLCCKTLILPADIFDESLLRMRTNYTKTVQLGEQKFIIMHSRCEWLRENNKCAFYNKRPPQCRGFPKFCERLWAKVNPECTALEKLD